jgi:hypothetical protein
MRRVLILLGLLVLGVIVTACSASTANIRSAVTSKGYENGKAVDPTTTFSPSDSPIHAVIEVGNAPTDTKIKAVWTVVDAVGADGSEIKDQKLTESEFLTKDTDSTVHFKLSTEQSWPVGKYKADIYMDDKLDRTLEFTVAE